MAAMRSETPVDEMQWMQWKVNGNYLVFSLSYSNRKKFENNSYTLQRWKLDGWFWEPGSQNPLQWKDITSSRQIIIKVRVSKASYPPLITVIYQILNNQEQLITSFTFKDFNRFVEAADW